MSAAPNTCVPGNGLPNWCKYNFDHCEMKWLYNKLIHVIGIVLYCEIISGVLEYFNNLASGGL